MQSVLIGLLLSVLAAVGVVLAVALPHLRDGAPVLTPDGERVARRVRRAARVARRSAEALAARVGESAAAIRDDPPARPALHGRSDPPTQLDLDAAAPEQRAPQEGGPRHMR